jgi:hypothetical protein
MIFNKLNINPYITQSDITRYRGDAQYSEDPPNTNVNYQFYYTKLKGRMWEFKGLKFHMLSCMTFSTHLWKKI